MAGASLPPNPLAVRGATVLKASRNKVKKLGLTRIQWPYRVPTLLRVTDPALRGRCQDAPNYGREMNGKGIITVLNHPCREGLRFSAGRCRKQYGTNLQRDSKNHKKQAVLDTKRGWANCIAQIL
jgi:hypothetical protein